MGCMFNECHELKEIKAINQFNTSKVTNMRAMFHECNNLINLDLNFDTSNVIDMGRMFFNCNQLKYLNIDFTLRNDCIIKNMLKYLNSKCVLNTHNNYIKSLFHH